LYELTTSGFSIAQNKSGFTDILFPRDLNQQLICSNQKLGGIMNDKKNEKFSKSGNSPCSHPSLIREFAYGAPTGNYICAQCECLLSSIIGAYKKTTG
jgi:hypothetical protein